MLTQRDLQFLAGGFALFAGLLALLEGLFAFTAPVWLAGAIFGAVAVTLVGLRVYVRIVGAERTQVDEAIEVTEDTIEQVSPIVQKAPPKPLRVISKVGPAALLILLAIGCRQGQVKDARDTFCSDRAYKAVDISCKHAIARARTDQELNRITTTCLETIEAQRLICGDVQ